MRFPLAYGLEEKQPTYPYLLEVVSLDKQAVQHGFPNWNKFGMTHYELATRLFKISRPHRPMAPKALVVRNRSFLSVLKVVHQALLNLTDRISEEEQEILIIGVLRKSLSLSKVQYFPAAKLKSGTVGALSSKPVFDS